MAIIPQDKTKKQKYLVVVLIVIIIVSVFIIRFYLVSEPEFYSTALPPAKPEEIKINFQVLEGLIMKKLQPFLEIPPFEGEVGRENPFVSYE